MRGHGCPFCSRRRCCKCQSLAAKHPNLMKQWDLEGNEGIDPYSVSCRSHKSISWMCSERHQWNATPNSRVGQGMGCLKCAQQRLLGSSRPQRGLMKDELPDIYAQLHPTKNSNLTTEALTCGSGKKVWWLCQSDKCRLEGCKHEHAWEVPVRQRCSQRNPTGCPFRGKRPRRICPCNSLAGRQPALMEYWDHEGNAIPLADPLDPTQLAPHSDKRVRWRHDCGKGQIHHWCAAIHSVVQKFEANGRVPCPGCAPAVRRATYAKGRQRLVKRE